MGETTTWANLALAQLNHAPRINVYCIRNNILNGHDNILFENKKKC